MGWQDAPEVGAAPAWASAPEVEQPKPKKEERVATPSFKDAVLNAPLPFLGMLSPKQVPDAVAGAVRGAGSIGATLMRPFETKAENEDRRQSMTNALGMLGADTNSFAFGAGKLGAEVAGTAGAGGAIAKGLSFIPGVSSAMPGVLNALQTGGMTTGQAVAPGALNALRDIGTRAVGGAIAGGAQAGLVNPSDAGTGALVGGALPVVTKTAGALGSAAGRAMRGPEVPETTLAAAQAARDAGYVIPPTQAKPTLFNRAVEGLGGKLTVAQNASAKNQEVTTSLAKQAIGLTDDAKLSTETLDGLRKEAGKAYDAVAKAGTFNASGANLPASVNVKTSIDPLIGGKVQSVDSAELVRAWKQANHDATAYYRAYGRDANPETLAKAKAAASSAKSIDDFLAKNLEAAGQSDLLQALKAARVQIAKTHTVEAALNPATGNVDAQKLAQMLKKDKPLSGELRKAAEFATAFPKAAQPVERMGSLPQTSPLDWAAAGSVSAATANPLMMAGVLARPAARATALSPMVQNRLATTANPNALADLLASPEAQQLLYRSAPVAISGR